MNICEQRKGPNLLPPSGRLEEKVILVRAVAHLLLSLTRSMKTWFLPQKVSGMSSL